MGKKGKWLTSVKKAFKSPIKDGEEESEVEARDLDLFGDIRPLALVMLLNLGRGLCAMEN